MAKNKASRLFGQLEEEGLTNTHRVLAIHHQVLAELLGVETSQEIPTKHVAKEPRKQVPEGVPSPPSAGTPEHAAHTSGRVAARDARMTRSGEATSGVQTSGDGPDTGEPGAKDSRLSKDGKVEDAKNTIGGPKKVKKAVDKAKEMIEEDEALAEESGTTVGDDHPDDQGTEDAETDDDNAEAEDDEEAEDEPEEEEEPRPMRVKRAGKSKKAAKKRR